MEHLSEYLLLFHKYYKTSINNQKDAICDIQALLGLEVNGILDDFLLSLIKEGYFDLLALE